MVSEGYLIKSQLYYIWKAENQHMHGITIKDTDHMLFLCCLNSRSYLTLSLTGQNTLDVVTDTQRKLYCFKMICFPLYCWTFSFQHGQHYSITCPCGFQGYNNCYTGTLQEYTNVSLHQAISNIYSSHPKQHSLHRGRYAHLWCSNETRSRIYVVSYSRAVFLNLFQPMAHLGAHGNIQHTW